MSGNQTSNFLARLVVAALVPLLLIFLVALGFYFYIENDLPRLPDNLQRIYMHPPTEIYSSDGVQLKVLGKRNFVELEMISPYFQKAIIAIEDARFYTHSGIDLISLARALWINLRSGRVVQGASTITQQLSKNLFFTFRKSLARKFKELLLALQMETTFSKKEILEAYCNLVYFGNGVFGIEEASNLYFGVRARDLGLLQAALLAGIPNSPNHLNPFKNYSGALNRAKQVLARMEQNGFITKAERTKALNERIKVKEFVKHFSSNLYFVDYVMDRLEREFGREFLQYGSLKIHTTLDTSSQENAQFAIRSHLEFLEKRVNPRNNHHFLQTALICLENATGAVRALVGGRNYEISQFNRALSNNRMPGSSFKPFVYMSAMRHLGYNPATVLVDEPVMVNIPGIPSWKPQNFNARYFGPVILKTALAKSLNTISVKLVFQLGPRKVIATARRFGITSPLKETYSLALGTSGVSPLEMASAYSVIANLGMYRRPYFIERIESYDGKLLFEHRQEKVRRFPAREMYPLLDMMLGVVENGSGRVVRRIGLRHPAGGKTGTTNDFRDAWFTGFTKIFTTSVWVGYDDNQPMLRPGGKGITGSQAAAPIWALFMKREMSGKPVVEFPVPSGIKFEYVDPTTGNLIPKNLPNAIRVAVPLETSLNLSKNSTNPGS